MGDQVIVKVLLVVVLIGIMAVLLIPRKGARPLAVRRLTYFILLIAGIAAVIFPGWLSWIAGLVGVGRGTDLLLYAFVVVFISHSIASKSRHAASDQRFTDLARVVAIQRAESAEDAGRRLIEGG